MKPLSRGAQRLLKLLRVYSSRYSDVFPFRATLARQLDVSYSQVGRYLLELKQHGLVKITQSGPQPSNYHVFANGNAQATRKQCAGYAQATWSGPYIGGIAQDGERRKPPQTETLIRDYFGTAQIGGKRADDRLVRDIAGLVGGNYQLFEDRCRGFLKRGKPQSWGIFLELARDTARAS